MVLEHLLFKSSLSQLATPRRCAQFEKIGPSIASLQLHRQKGMYSPIIQWAFRLDVHRDFWNVPLASMCGPYPSEEMVTSNLIVFVSADSHV